MKRKEIGQCRKHNWKVVSFLTNGYKDVCVNCGQERFVTHTAEKEVISIGRRKRNEAR